jgi:hypothetical protein
MLLRKASGFFIIGAAIFLFSFWGYRSTTAVLSAFADQGREGNGGPLVTMIPVFQFMVWTVIAAVLYFLGRRLSDPDHFEKQAAELARHAVSRNDGPEEGDPGPDEVSTLYEDLSLEELVLINSSIDRIRYSRRYLRLTGEMKRRLQEREEGKEGAGGGRQRGD